LSSVPAGPEFLGNSSDLSTRRYRQALASSGVLAIKTVIAFATPFLLLPLLLHHLDSQRFSFWMTLSSLTALIGIADLGLGYGLMTATASASADSGHKRIQLLASSAVGALLLIAAVLGLCLVPLVSLLPLEQWLGISDIPAKEVRTSVFILTAGLLVASVVGITSRVQTGLQTGYLSSAWAAGASIVTLCVMMASVKLDVSFPALVALSVATPIVVGLANAAWYFGRHAPALRPRLGDIDPKVVTTLFRTGFLFFVLQVAHAVTFTTDNLILATTVGIEAVPAYALPARLAACISLAVAILLQPLWPAYAEAAARNDFAWIRTAFCRSVMAAFALSTLGASLLYVFRTEIFAVWTDNMFVVDQEVLGALVVWAVLESCGIALAMLFNGLNIVRFQVVLVTINALVSIPVRIWMLDNVGIWGLPLATCLVYFVTTVVPFGLFLPRVLRLRASGGSQTAVAVTRDD
jgi:O-antigen/teichoic acid export membrane protein